MALNILLTQHDNLYWSLCNVEVYTEHPEISDYYVTGRSVYNVDGLNIYVYISWEVTINTDQSVNDKNSQCNKYNYNFKCQDSELDSVYAPSVEKEEVDQWLDEFITSISWQSDAINVLPEPIMEPEGDLLSMAFSVRITGISKDTGQAIFKMEPSWWDGYQLTNDERFTDTSHDLGYLDFDAKMSIEEMRELHEKYRVKVLNVGYKHFYPESLKLEEALYMQSESYSHFYVTVFEWESGL